MARKRDQMKPKDCILLDSGVHMRLGRKERDGMVAYNCNGHYEWTIADVVNEESSICFLTRSGLQPGRLAEYSVCMSVIIARVI